MDHVLARSSLLSLSIDQPARLANFVRAVFHMGLTSCSLAAHPPSYKDPRPCFAMTPHSRRLMFFSFAIDDDYVDRLNHFLTSALLLLGVIISSKTQYFGKPISCWTPAIFTDAHVEYAENMCWVKSTYTHSLTALHLPRSDEERAKTSIIYYQWVPFFLLIQALLFQVIPDLIRVKFVALGRFLGF